MEQLPAETIKPHVAREIPKGIVSQRIARFVSKTVMASNSSSNVVAFESESSPSLWKNCRGVLTQPSLVTAMATQPPPPPTPPLTPSPVPPPPPPPMPPFQSDSMFRTSDLRKPEPLSMNFAHVLDEIRQDVPLRPITVHHHSPASKSSHSDEVIKEIRQSVHAQLRPIDSQRTVEAESAQSLNSSRPIPASKSSNFDTMIEEIRRGVQLRPINPDGTKFPQSCPKKINLQVSTVDPLYAALDRIRKSLVVESDSE